MALKGEFNEKRHHPSREWTVRKRQKRIPKIGAADGLVYCIAVITGIITSTKSGAAPGYAELFMLTTAAAIIMAYQKIKAKKQQ